MTPNPTKPKEPRELLNMLSTPYVLVAEPKLAMVVGRDLRGMAVRRTGLLMTLVVVASVEFDCSLEHTTLPNYFGCRDVYGQNRTLTASFQRSPILFVHIPKAGGSTIEALLKEYAKTTMGLRELSVYRVSTLNRWLKEGGQEKHPMSLFDSKHDVDAEYFVAPLVMATMLRHPAERIVSHYRYIVGTHYPGACTTRKKSFADWYRANVAYMPDINNFEVRLLVSRDEDENIEATSETSAVIDDHKCHYHQKLPPVTRTHLDFAKARLQRMSLIGILEHFEKTMFLWNASLPGLFYDKHKDIHVCGNADHRVCGGTHALIHSDHHPPPSSKVVAAAAAAAANGTTEETSKIMQDPLLASFMAIQSDVRRDNWASVELYDFARSLFDEQLSHSNLPPSLRRRR